MKHAAPDTTQPSFLAGALGLAAASFFPALAQETGNAQPATLTADPLIEAGAEAGGVDIPVQILLDRPAPADFSVMARLVDGSATVGLDVAPLVATIPFSKGEITRTITVDILDDAIDEPAEETILLEISPVSGDGHVVIAAPVTPLTIEDDDTHLRLTGDQSWEEGETAMLRLEADFPPNEEISLALGLEDLGATPDEDFILQDGEMAFPAGAKSLLIPVPLLDDPVDEPDESFRVSVSSPDPRARVAPGSLEVTIEGGCQGASGPAGALVDEACQWWWNSSGPCHDFSAHGAKAWVARGQDIRAAIREQGGRAPGFNTAGWGVVLGSETSPAELARTAMSGMGGGQASMHAPGTAILMALQGPETVYLRDDSGPEDGSGVAAQSGAEGDSVSLTARYHPEHARVTGRFQGSGTTACNGEDVEVSFRGGFSLPYDPEDIALPDMPEPSAGTSSGSSYERPSASMTDAQLDKMIDTYERLVEITQDHGDRQELLREIERLKKQKAGQ